MTALATPLEARPSAAADEVDISAGPGTDAYPFRHVYTLLLILALGLYSEVGLWKNVYIVPDEANPITTLHKDMVWLLTLGGLAIHCVRNGFKFIGPMLTPFVPMAVLGLGSSVFGIDPVGSVRALLYWGFCLTAGSVVSLEMPSRNLRLVLFWVLFAELAISIAVAVLLPDYGRQNDIRSSEVWRGAYTNKNILGWVAVWSLGAAWFFRREVGLLAAVSIGAMALLCLYKAHSQGSIVAVVIVVGLLVLLRVTRSIPVSAGAQAAITIMLTAVGAAGVFVLSDKLLPLLGRDATLTGRTDIWREFLRVAVQRWPIGFGPGSFTTSGPIVDEMAIRFAYTGGLVRTPHNMYIATFGEGGIIGLAAYVSALLYLGIIEPLKRTTAVQLAAAAAALTIVGGGLIETHEVYQAGLGAFILFVMRGMASPKHAAEQVATASALSQAPPGPARLPPGPKVLGGPRHPAPVAGRLAQAAR